VPACGSRTGGDELAMRDPMSWSFTVFRAFGIPVRVHLLFILVTVGLFIRQLGMKDNPIWWVDLLCYTVLVPFVVIVLHEFGHCFGARSVGGDAKEVLIWPLGGLAYVDVPHTPRANLVATAAGPFVNVLICLACAVGLVAGGFIPNMNPLTPILHPYVSEMYNYQKERDYTSGYGLKMYKAGTSEPVPTPVDAVEKLLKDAGITRDRITWPPETTAAWAAQMEKAGAERALAPEWAVWLNRIFGFSWFLFLFNLIPAYPLDGGRLLQCFAWARTDYRRGVTIASYSGYVFAVIFLLVSIGANESLFMGLALFIFYMSWMALQQLDMDDGPFGYDFSAGYTSLEKDDEPPPKPKKVGWFTRWRQARRARRLQREAEERARDEERMDQILDKIARTGKESLTDEERRFLERYSARRRNMS
jgi:Zn-dependent protease